MVNTADRDHEGIRSIISTILLIIIAPLIAILLTAFVFQSYEVDGPSMETTLRNHDRLVVLKVKRSWARLTGHDYIPERGDIVVFDKQGLTEFGGTGERQLIKRIIALPGERVVVHDGQLTVFNKQRPAGFQPDKEADYGSVIPSTSGELDIVVPGGQVFVCGDNRNNSLDSRMFGPVPARDIVGKLSLRVYPFNSAKHF
jgi:signal peptidase I